MQDIVELLQGHEVSPTPQRIAVAEAALYTKEHPSADDIWGIVRRKWPTLSRTTVYNTLNLLVDRGVLKPRVIKEGKIIYDGETSHVTDLFGSYRTMKLQITGFAEETIGRIEESISKQYGAESSIEVQNTERGWTDIVVNPEETPLAEVLSLMMNTFPVRDVRIVEIAMEDVVQRIYAGALQ